MNTTKLRSTLAGIIGLLAVVGPRLLNLLGTPTNHWASLAVQAFGAIVLACASGEGMALLNKFMPTPDVPATGALPVRTGVGQGGFATVQAMVAGFFFAVAGTLILCLGLAGCHNVTPDQFLNATVDCAKTNPQASAALASVETCLIGAVSQNPAVCLTGLVTEVHFTVDEIACVVAYVAQQNQAKVATGKYTDDDLRSRQAANDFLAKEHISIRNTYKGQ